MRDPVPPFKFSPALALLAAGLALPLSAADQRLAPPPPPALALPEAEAPRGSGDDLRLVWFDPLGVMPAPLLAVHQEVEAIFRRFGVRVRWSRGDLGTVVRASGAEVPEIPVVLLPDDPVAGRRGRRIMGLVPKDSDATRPVWLFLANIRWTLQQRPGRTLSPTDQAELSRAVARVIAHEVVHAVAPHEPHTRQSGLMHGNLDRGFLVGPEAVLDSDCAQAFLKALARLKGPVAAPATAETGSSAHRLAAP
jgi:hypothetical protein